MDSAALVPWLFVRRVDEGGMKFNQDYIFNRVTNKVNIGNNETFPIKDDTQDMVSAFILEDVLIIATQNLEMFLLWRVLLTKKIGH